MSPLLWEMLNVVVVILLVILLVKTFFFLFKGSQSMETASSVSNSSEATTQLSWSW
uniref:ATP synthase F0 subunit 8 n=1 Tax=Sminthurides bifidus TaxID=2584528 RepID=A0A6H0EX20_9HEXA|nr:ATP synthase F0 subunit 8 [Sminthurides bifidus]